MTWNDESVVDLRKPQNFGELYCAAFTVAFYKQERNKIYALHKERKEELKRLIVQALSSGIDVYIVCGSLDERRQARKYLDEIVTDPNEKRTRVVFYLDKVAFGPLCIDWQYLA